MNKGVRKGNGGFELSEAPSHLIRRCQQFYGDLYAREAGGKELTKQQFTLLCALEQNDGTSQTALVEITGIDRSTLAEMVRLSHGHTMRCAAGAHKPRGFNMRGVKAVDHTTRPLQRWADKNLHMDFCTQNRFNFGFRTAASFLQPECGA